MSKLKLIFALQNQKVHVKSQTQVCTSKLKVHVKVQTKLSLQNDKSFVDFIAINMSSTYKASYIRTLFRNLFVCINESLLLWKTRLNFLDLV